MAKDDRRGVWIPDELWEAAKQEARKLSVQHGRDISTSAIVRDGLRLMLRRIEQENFSLQVPGAETNPEPQESTEEGSDGS